MAVETAIARGKLFVGADGTLRVTVYATDSNGLNYGDTGYITTAQDMTGWALELTLREHRSDGNGKQVFSTTTATLSNANGTNDRAAFAIPKANTSSLAPGVYDFAIWRTDDGSDMPVAWGTIPLTGAAAQ